MRSVDKHIGIYARSVCASKKVYNPKIPLE
jgi:hypothetical protein